MGFNEPSRERIACIVSKQVTKVVFSFWTVDQTEHAPRKCTWPKPNLITIQTMA